MQSSDLDIFRKLRLKYPKNPFIQYLNINFLKNEIIDVLEMIGRLQLYFFVISETNLNLRFSFTQFYIGDYESEC